jgi:hypothetical protein
MRFLISTVLLLSISLTAHAGIKKWVDADGNVHYSDSGPEDNTQTQSVRNIAGKDQANAPSGYTPKSPAEREAEMKKARKLKDEAAQKQAEQDTRSAAKKQNCEIARQNAKTLEESPRVIKYDANGERVVMEDDARAKNLEEARKAISENCN